MDMLSISLLTAHGFGDMKNGRVAALGLQRDALHIHFGLLIFFAVWLAIRGQRGAWVALGLVVIIALGAETWDHIYERSIHKACDWPDHLSDLFNTCIWPMLLTLAAHWQSRRAQAKRPS
jgi:hypothetical protein